MKAMRVHEYGGVEQLSLDEIATPVPGAGEILVRVGAAGVNPVDWKVRSGLTRGLVEVAMPYIPGAEVAGTVAACGADVDGFAPGDRVMALTGLFGGYAESIVLPAALVVAIPDTLDFARAASAPLSVQTAWGCIEMAALDAGQRMLIVGAAGGVGSAAVQFARLRGIEVIATCSAANADRVAALGADRVVAYDRDAVDPAEIGPLDAIVDVVGAETSAPWLEALRPDGLYISGVSPLDVQQIAPRFPNATFFGIAPDPERQRVTTAHLADGRVTLMPPIVFPLALAGEAMTLSETGHAPSRIVLTIADAA